MWGVREGRGWTEERVGRGCHPATYLTAPIPAPSGLIATQALMSAEPIAHPCILPLTVALTLLAAALAFSPPFPPPGAGAGRSV